MFEKNKNILFFSVKNKKQNKRIICDIFYVCLKKKKQKKKGKSPHSFY